MILKQYYLACLAHASYLIVDEKDGVAVVVDPQRDVDGYLEDAEKLGVTISHVFLTHFHADFLAGHLELRKATGATIHLGAKAEAEFPFEKAAEGPVLETSELRLEVLETPGHTPEGISIVVYDKTADASKPKAVLTGDTLFIGDVGRPDLLASIGFTAEELASMLYDSLHGKLMKLPDETLVYPAHGAGSLCGKNLSKDTVSTIGAQKLGNYALQPMTKEAFIAMMTQGQPAAPGYFVHDAILNRQERGTLDEALVHAHRPLNLATVERHLEADDAAVVDVRDAAAFAEGHLRGSLNIGLDGKYATWAGTFVAPERDIVIVAEPGREREAAMRLGRIGFDRILGFLEGGIAAAAGSKRLATQERMSVEELKAAIDGGKGPVVLDVRQPGEYGPGHIPGARNLPIGEIPERLSEIPRSAPVLVSCRTGYRSSLAASLLERAGFRNVIDQPGGWVAWEAAGFPAETAPEASCSKN